MKIKVKRVYDKAEKGDGVRLLADRLWPRGLKKDKAAIDGWIKELTPSAGLRKWFHANPKERGTAFKKRYRAELKKQRPSISRFQSKYKYDTVTLVTSVKDVDRSHIPVLLATLRKKKEEIS